jgi:hypothetical protein
MPPPVSMRSLLVATVVCALFAGAVGLDGDGAQAAGLTAPVIDCNAHARLTRRYTIAQLQAALATMPAEVREYTDCADVIQRQLLAQLARVPAARDGAARPGGSLVPVWLIVLLAVLLAGVAGFGALAVRERRRRPRDTPLH